MSLLRIVVGYKTEAFREEVPAILFVGYDAGAARQASDEADPKFHRVELLESRGGQRLRRQSPAVSPAAANQPQSGASAGEPSSAPETPADSAPAGSAGDTPGQEEEAPSLGPKKRR